MIGLRPRLKTRGSLYDLIGSPRGSSIDQVLSAERQQSQFDTIEEDLEALPALPNSPPAHLQSIPTTPVPTTFARADIEITIAPVSLRNAERTLRWAS